MRKVLGIVAVLACAACGGEDATEHDAAMDAQRDAGGDRTPRVCVPGYAVACVGVGGCAGGQPCNAAGTGYEPCECAWDGGIEDGSAGDAVVQTDAVQTDTLPQSDVLPQGDVIQHDAYPYTPGVCDPSNDQCLGAPTFPCRSTGVTYQCPCLPAPSDPNCRAGEFCCSGLCYETATAPCI